MAETEVKSINGRPVADVTARAKIEEIPKVFDWAVAELPFTEDEISDTASGAGFVVNPTNFADGKTYFRYHAGATSFTWTNPNPKKGSVTITARGISQWGGTGGTRLLTIYDDGTYGPALYIVVNGESQTSTVTTDPEKTLAKITGNYDLENWILLDMDVMSIVADYPAPGGSAEVTAESIENALGYTPADDAEVTELSEAIAELSNPSWNDLTDKPFEATEGEVDYAPEQNVTFSNGYATLTGFPDIFFAWDNSLAGTAVILVVNGEKYEGTLTFSNMMGGYSCNFGAYNFSWDNLTIADGANVADGDTATVRMYAVQETITTLDEKYLPDSVRTSITYTEQTLTAAQQKQAKKNINSLAIGTYIDIELSTADQEIYVPYRATDYYMSLFNIFYHTKGGGTDEKEAYTSFTCAPYQISTTGTLCQFLIEDDSGEIETCYIKITLIEHGSSLDYTKLAVRLMSEASTTLTLQTLRFIPADSESWVSPI